MHLSVNAKRMNESKKKDSEEGSKIMVRKRQTMKYRLVDGFQTFLTQPVIILSPATTISLNYSDIFHTRQRDRIYYNTHSVTRKTYLQPTTFWWHVLDWTWNFIWSDTHFACVFSVFITL